MVESSDAKRLWDEISNKRKEMSDVFEQEANTQKVLALSQELDQLLNQYVRIMNKEKWGFDRIQLVTSIKFKKI